MVKIKQKIKRQKFVYTKEVHGDGYFGGRIKNGKLFSIGKNNLTTYKKIRSKNCLHKLINNCMECKECSSDNCSNCSVIHEILSIIESL